MRGKEQFDLQNEYNRTRYDRVGLMLPKGQAEVWRECAKAEGLSLNAFVTMAVKRYIEGQTEKLDNPDETV